MRTFVEAELAPTVTQNTAFAPSPVSLQAPYQHARMSAATDRMYTSSQAHHLSHLCICVDSGELDQNPATGRTVALPHSALGTHMSHVVFVGSKE